MKRLSIVIMILAAACMVSCGEFFSDMGIKASLNEGLFGYWPIIGTANPQKDYSGYGNDIGYMGAATFITGKFGTANSFIGVGNYAWVSGITNIDFSTKDTVSISCWVYLPNDNNIYTTLVQADNTLLEFNNTGYAHQLRFQIASAIYSSSTGLTIGSWQYVTGTYDGKTVRLYINGELVGETISQNQLPNPADIYFRTSSGDDLYIDEVRIYDRALSQDEIKELMGMGM